MTFVHLEKTDPDYVRSGYLILDLETSYGEKKTCYKLDLCEVFKIWAFTRQEKPNKRCYHLGSWEMSPVCFSRESHATEKVKISHLSLD